MPGLERIVAKLPPPLTRFVVPYVEVTHNRVPVEIMRGCTRGCRFCQAGMITRPVRERTGRGDRPRRSRTLGHTGYEEVGCSRFLLGLRRHPAPGEGGQRSNSPARHLTFRCRRCASNLFSVELMDVLQSNSHRGGFTLAPEAATERMPRDHQQAGIHGAGPRDGPRDLRPRLAHHQALLHDRPPHARRSMTSRPSPTCAEPCLKWAEAIGKRAQVHAGVSTFVPKPHTPFQWVPCDTWIRFSRSRSS